MQRYDVLIVGGGPAGSSCAWALRRGGARVLVVDRARFPRDKICAGWITPVVLRALSLAPAEYAAAGLTLQEIRAFRTGVIDGPQIETRYDAVISYAIRRCEFDRFLLVRSGASVRESTPLSSLERTARGFVVNGAFEAPLLVGAGGHFCPVARYLGRGHRAGGLVVAQEAEVPLSRSDRCTVAGTAPELFFCHDLDGYGWSVRKGAYLNVGIGRRNPADFPAHARAFSAWLVKTGRAPASAARAKWRGHAYLLAGAATRTPIDDGILLVGDAAGLAYPESGEGIRPAVESGLAAARTVLDAAGRYSAGDLAPYAEWVRNTCPARQGTPALLRPIVPALGRALLRSRAFTRSVVIDRWFLRGEADDTDAPPRAWSAPAAS
jgi:flavin-dependent dehydrogenase